MVHYIDHLNEGLSKVGIETQQRFLMQSNGGVMPFSAAITGGRTRPHAVLRPRRRRAGQRLPGARGGAAPRHPRHGRHQLRHRLHRGGAPLETTEGTVARRQLDVPALDMTTISAGGGSIAWIDGGGFLTVGPHSAGADPGPACYGRGGKQPTVTDADLVCGYLNPDYFLGGKQILDVAASRAALDRHIAQPLKLARLVAAAASGASSHADGRRGPGVRRQARRRPVGFHQRCRSAAPARCTPRRWPTSSA